MPKETDKVTVLCDDAALAARIRGTGRERPLRVEAPDDETRIYEYAPALYVHVPEVRDLETARSREPNLGSAPDSRDPEVALHRDLESNGPCAPGFVGGAGDLHAAIRKGLILAVAFAEKFVIDADARRKQREVNGFIEQLRLLESDLEREERELIEAERREHERPRPPKVDLNVQQPIPATTPLEHLVRKLMEPPEVDYKGILAQLGDSHVHRAYKAAQSWVRVYHLDTPPPNHPRNRHFDVKRARAEFKKLRKWFEGTTGWIQGACSLTGLLPWPWPGVWDAGFVFVTQNPPDRKPQAASPAVEWVTGLLPFLVPEIVVRVEPRFKPSAESEPLPPLPERDLAVAQGTAEMSEHRSNAQRVTARFYSDDWGSVLESVRPDEVHIEPLLINGIGQTLGIAVRIRKGAVLVLPECRDDESKARLIRLMATDLWEPIQEWREPRPEAAIAPNLNSGEKTPDGKAKSTPPQDSMKRSWLQPELDRAIDQYKAARGAEYRKILSVLNNRKATPSERSVANKSARKLFGRNAITKALGVKAAKMVSDSPAWMTVAEALGFSLRRRHRAGFRQTGKVGLDIAIDEKSQNPTADADNSAADARLLNAEREKTLREINKLAQSGKSAVTRADRAKESALLLEKYNAGEQTDEQVRQTVETLLSDDT